MTAALVALAVGFLTATAALVFAVWELGRARSEATAALHVAQDQHAMENRQLVNAVIARHSGDVAATTRAEQLPATIAAQMQTYEPSYSLHEESLVDRETGEPMIPLGMG